MDTPTHQDVSTSWGTSYEKVGTKKIDNNSKPDWCGRLLMVGKKVMLMIGLNKN